MRRVNRPERKLTHLLEKIELKKTIALKKPGRRTRRWKQFAEKYKALVASPQA